MPVIAMHVLNQEVIPVVPLQNLTSLNPYGVLKHIRTEAYHIQDHHCVAMDSLVLCVAAVVENGTCVISLQIL